MLSKNEIDDLVFRVILSRVELEEYDEEISDLFRACQSKTEVDVLKHLLNELYLPTLDQLPSKLNDMAKIAKNLMSDGGSLAIVAMAYDGSADGSQAVIHLLKPKLGRGPKHKFFNTVPQFLKKGGIDEYPRFLLVDDFTGSGQTVLNRMKEIESNAKGRGISIESNICLLFGMEGAYLKILGQGYKVQVLNALKAGLSGHYSGAELSTRLEAMKRLETLLAPSVEGKPMPSMGYNGAEALFCIKETNAPNSNFPIFWWPSNRDGSERRTLMVRAEL